MFINKPIPIKTITRNKTDMFSHHSKLNRNLTYNNITRVNLDTRCLYLLTYYLTYSIFITSVVKLVRVTCKQFARVESIKYITRRYSF